MLDSLMSIRYTHEATMDNRLNPAPLAWRESLARLPWRRAHRREDVHHGHEPRVRMDIQTAVQIASLSDYPLGPVELLTDTAPATPVPVHEMPCMATAVIDNTVSEAVDMGRRYRDRLNTRIRQAREAYRLDGDIARSSAFVVRMLRDEKIARVIMWACGGVAAALLVTLGVWLVS